MINVRHNKNIGCSDDLLIESAGKNMYCYFEIPLQCESYDLLQAKWELEKALMIINHYTEVEDENY